MTFRPSRAAVVTIATLVLATALGIDAASAAVGDIRAKRRQVQALSRALAEIDAQAGAAATTFNAALDRRDVVRARIGETRTSILSNEVILKRSRTVLSGRVRDAYLLGEIRPIDVFLQSGSISDAAAVGTAIERSAAVDAEVVASIGARRRALVALRSQLAVDAVAARRAVATASTERKKLNAVLTVRRSAVGRAKRELGTLVAQEDARIARLAAEKRAALLATQPSPSAGSNPGPTAPAPSVALPAGGNFVFPIAGPTRFSDDWLAPRAGGRYHEGIDLFAARGTPVVAVADGTLFRVGYSGISGYRLWLRDAQGTTYFYAHMDGYAPAAREGATVTRGTVLAYNGDTGDARGTSPHVHFEIHPGGGGPIRPYPIVSTWPRAG